MKALREVLEGAGLTVDSSKAGGNWEITITAPAGHWFPLLDVHEVVIGDDRGDSVRELWKDVKADWDAGSLRPVPCTVADCEWCHD